jgi:hypothetical protein
MSEKKNKTPFFTTSKYVYNGDLLEQVYIPEKKQTYFLRYDKKNDETINMDRVEEHGNLYLPIVDDLLQKEVVILPTKTEEYGTEDDLELEIECFIKTWLDVSDEHLQKAVWYVLLTWVSDNLHTLPYLRALGDYGTGKTRYLDVIGGICYKPMFVGGSVRSAPIYRVIDRWRGTAIFDEFTLNKSDETEDIVQILNNGFQRGKPVLRCKEGSNSVIAFDPFGPKILATRNTFKDKALESRCLTEILKVTSRKDIPIDLNKKFFEKRKELQNKLLLYRFRNHEHMEIDESLNIDFGNIIPRVKQSFSSFVVLFQYNQERLNNFIRYVKEYNKEVVEENASSFDGQIFNAYMELLNYHTDEQQSFDDYKPDHITSSDIKNKLVENGWSEEKLHASTIGRHLKSLGFKTKPTKIAGKTKKVLEVDDELYKNLVSRYGVTVVTEVTEV